MKFTFRPFLLLFILFAALVQQTEAHPYHVSIAEVKYNARSQSLEVALKIFTDDLEKTLSVGAKKVITINQSAEMKKQLEAYLKQHFRLENSAGKPYSQQFLGHEPEADAQWLYLEIPVKATELKQARLRNQVLLETFPDQVNLVNLHLSGQKKTLIFKEGDVLQVLQ